MLHAWTMHEHDHTSNGFFSSIIEIYSHQSFTAWPCYERYHMGYFCDFFFLCVSAEKSISYNIVGNAIFMFLTLLVFRVALSKCENFCTISFNDFIQHKIRSRWLMLVWKCQRCIWLFWLLLFGRSLCLYDYSTAEKRRN